MDTNKGTKMLQFVQMSAYKDSNNFCCASNLSKFGNLMIGALAPISFEEATAEIYALGAIYRAHGYKVTMTVEPLTDSMYIDMLKECGAI